MDGHSRFGPDVSYPVEIAQAGTGEAIGQVDTTQGGAFVVHADGTSIPAEAGMPIYLGDVIETKAGGTIGVVFADNSTFSLAEQGKMTIDDMVYDPATAQGHSLVSVAEGVFTFVSGEIAKTGVDAMQIDTPVATIGIRGSAGGGNIVNPQLLDPNSTVPPSGTFSNFRDPFTGQAGELFINTPTGSQTLNGVNATTNVPNPFVPPSPPIVLPGAVVQNVFAPAVRSLPAPRAAGNQQGGLGNLTTNDPAPAGQGAQQAAAQAAAVQAFAQAVAQGGNLATALAAATQIAQQAATRFGVDPAALDGFTPQVAANEIVASIINQVLGGLGGFGPGNPLAAGANGQSEFTVSSEQLAALVSNIVDGVIANTQVDIVGALASVLGGFVQSGLLSGAFADEVLADALQQAQDVIGQLASTAADALAAGDLAALTTTFAAAQQTVEANVVSTIEQAVTDVINTIFESVSDVSRTVDVSGTATVTLQAGVNDLITGSSGNDTVTLSGQATAGDLFDGADGTDTVILDAYANTFLVENVETVKLPQTSSSQAITMGTAGSMTLSNASGSTTGPDAPFALAGTPLSGSSSLNQTVTLSFTLPQANSYASSSSFSMDAGTDTIVLANGENYVYSAVGVETWQLSDGGANTFYLGVAMTGQTVYGSTAADTVTVSGVGSNDSLELSDGNDVLVISSGSETPFLSGGSGTDTVRLSPSSSISIADSFFSNASGFESFEIGANKTYSITAGSNFQTAFSTGSSVAVGLASGVTAATVTFDGSGLTQTLSYSAANNSGSDIVTGGSGNDTIITGGGADTVVGGDGNDTFTLAAASDLASGSSYTGSNGTDTLNLASSIGSVTLDFSNVTLATVETLDFSNATAASVTLLGSQLSGISTITGTSGTDTLTLSSGGDISGITVTNIENVTLSGSGVTFADSSASHAITGTAGADSITISSGGDDSVNTGSGGAMVTAGAAFDANDSITGVAGTSDTLSLSGDYSNGLTLSNVTNLDTLTLADGNSYNFTLNANTADSTNGLTINGSSLTGTNTLTADGSSSDDHLLLNGGAGDDSLTGGSGNDSFYGNGGSDTIDITHGGNDTVQTGSGGATVNAGAALTSSDYITGTNGVTDVLNLTGDYSAGLTLSNVTEINTINLTGTYNYNLTLASGTADTTNGLAINAASLGSSYALTLNGSYSNDILTINGGAGADTLVGGSQADTINASGGADVITGGDGADSITLSTDGASDTIIFNASSEFGDTVTDFNAGATNGDIITTNNLTISNGTGTAFEALASGDTIGTNTGFVNYTTDIANYTTAGDVATALNTINGLQTGDSILFATGNGTSTRIWYWSDGSGGTANGTVDSGELHQVVDLTGVNNDNLTADNTGSFA